MTFYAAEIDACPAYGWQGGPSIEVLIKRLRSRREKRDRQTDWFQHSYILPFQNIESQEYLDYIKSAFMALGGPTDSFLVKDWGDFQAFQEPLGVAPSGSTPVQLLKTYDFQGLVYYSRQITKPLQIWVNPDESIGTFLLRSNGVTKPGTLNTLTGLFTPTDPWTPGQELDWTGEFRVPCRFDQFSLPSTIDNRRGDGYAANGSVSLIEVFGE